MDMNLQSTEHSLGLVTKLSLGLVGVSTAPDLTALSRSLLRNFQVYVLSVSDRKAIARLAVATLRHHNIGLCDDEMLTVDRLEIFITIGAPGYHSPHSLHSPSTV